VNSQENITLPNSLSGPYTLVIQYFDYDNQYLDAEISINIELPEISNSPENNSDPVTEPQTTNDTSNNQNSSDIADLDDFKGDIPSIYPESGFNVIQYIDLIGIIGLQAGTTLRKFKN